MLTQEPVPAPRTAPALQRARFIVGGILAFLLLGSVVVLVMRSFQATALAAATQEHAKRYVTTILPQQAGNGLPLTLPGTLLGINEATVYARSNGYILRWTKDIGSAVKKGDLLAEITAPGNQPGVIAGDRGARAGRAAAKPWRKSPRSAGEAFARKTPSLSRNWMSGRAPTGRRRPIWPRRRPM